MSDDVDTIPDAEIVLEAIDTNELTPHGAKVRNEGRAALDRVVAERDELRARLQQQEQQQDAVRHFASGAEAATWLLSDDNEREADPGGASGASSTAMISAERARQITAEGWTAEHDDRHSRGSLAEAAVCYARPKREMIEEWDDDEDRAVMVPVGWPWEPRFWRPTPDDRVRELVKAGALIAAEIDRVLRAEVSGGTSTGSAPQQDFGGASGADAEPAGMSDRYVGRTSYVRADALVAAWTALALLVADIPCGNGCGCEEYDYCAEDEGNRALSAFTPIAFAEDLERYTTATGNRSLQDPDSDSRARVVLLEEALRGIADLLKGGTWNALYGNIEKAAVVARAALVGDAPPAPNEPGKQAADQIGAAPAEQHAAPGSLGAGAPPARAEDSQLSGDSA